MESNPCYHCLTGLISFKPSWSVQLVCFHRRQLLVWITTCCSHSFQVPRWTQHPQQSLLCHAKSATTCRWPPFSSARSALPPLPQLPVPLHPHSGRLEKLHLDSLSGSLFIWKNGDNNSTYLHSVLERWYEMNAYKMFSSLPGTQQSTRKS